MKYIITANDQAYQSIYINPKAENWQEVIVFHDPIFDNEMPGVIVLKSLRLENCLGFVFTAPKSIIRSFRDKVKQKDVDEQLGKLKPQELINRLIKMIAEMGGSITYIQNESIQAPKEDIEGIPRTKEDKKQNLKDKKEKKEQKEQKEQKEKITDSFFDPLTKRKLITEGPAYFDPSLPHMETDGKKEIKAKFLSKDKQYLFSPKMETFPAEINLSNLNLWNQVIASHDVCGFEDNKTRWSYIKTKYESFCQDLEVPPYQKMFSVKAEIFTDIKESFKNALVFVHSMRDRLKQKYPQTDISARLKLSDVKLVDTYVFLIAELSIKNPPDDIIDELLNERKFRLITIGQVKNLTKQIGERINLVISEKEDQIKIFISYKLPRSEAMELGKIKDESKVRFVSINSFKKIISKVF